MKFCSRLTCPVTSVSAVTPSHWTWTSLLLEAAHWAPVLPWFQKSKPTALGTTARRWAPVFFWAVSPPPPPLGSLTDPHPATASASAAPTASGRPSDLRTCMGTLLLVVTPWRRPGGGGGAGRSSRRGRR